MEHGIIRRALSRISHKDGCSGLTRFCKTIHIPSPNTVNENIYNICSNHWWRHQWKHFPRYWSFVPGIHRSPLNSPHKGQCRGAMVFSLILGWTNGWVNNREAGDLRHNCANYDVIVMEIMGCFEPCNDRIEWIRRALQTSAEHAVMRVLSIRYSNLSNMQNICQRMT